MKKCIWFILIAAVFSGEIVLAMRRTPYLLRRSIPRSTKFFPGRAKAYYQTGKGSSNFKNWFTSKRVKYPIYGVAAGAGAYGIYRAVTEDEAPFVYEYAIQNDKPEILKKVLLKKAIDINRMKPGPLGRTPLTEFIESWSSGKFQENGKELLKLFIEAGADINKVDKLGSTALDYAVESLNREAVQILLEHGARSGSDKFAESGDGRDSLLRLMQKAVKVFQHRKPEKAQKAEEISYLIRARLAHERTEKLLSEAKEMD